MHSTRTFTPGRIVALALIAVLVGGLAYLRFAPDPGSATVPAGAKAGDLSLEPCRHPTEGGSYAADCGTLVVPENRADPRSRLIAVPVTRVHARSANPAAPIFRLEGGPGRTNMEFPAASRFAERHDVVLVGYRGADGSVRLDCPEVESALARSTDFLGEKSMRAYADAFRACAARLTDDGVDLRGYSLVQQVDDLEAARRALGYDRVDLLSESAGTRLALVYAWRYPKRVHRSVMIGVNPPGNFLWDARTTDEQIRRYAALCEKDETCSRRTLDLAVTMSRTAAAVPDRWGPLRIEQGNVRIASFYGLMESSSAAAPLSAPLTLGSWLSAANGDASGFWLMSLLGRLVFPKSFVWGELAAVGRIDADVAKRFFASPERRRASILGNAGTEFIWAGGRLADAWPATPDEDTYDRLRTSRVETLLVGGALDVATPPQAATEQLLPYLPNGRQVVLPGFGHTTSFWSDQPEAGTRLITAFLGRGTVDDSLYRPQRVDFTPAVTLPAIAKIAAGTMAGLALLTLLSLLWMAWRVHRRGRFGRTAGVLLRSLYPFVLGVGGWLLGVLVVATTMPGVALDDGLLVMVSVGLPVGLCVYLAWVDREWPGERKRIGLAAALSGAPAGAFLGLHAATGMLALVTAIAGAVAGANLLLIVLAMTLERSGARVTAATAPSEPRGGLPA